MAGVMIGIDPHKASHTATAIDGAEKVLGKVRVKADRGSAGAAVGVGLVLAGADVGGGECHRCGPSASPSSCWPPGGGVGCAAQAGGQGPAALGWEHEQERPQRRSVGGGGRAALDQGPPRSAGGLLGCHGCVVGPLPGACRGPHPGGVPAARPALRAGARRRPRRSSRQRGAAGAREYRSGGPRRSRPSGRWPGSCWET